MKKILFFVCLVIVSNFIFGQTKSQADFNIELLSNVRVSENCNDIWGFVDNKGTEYAVLGSVAATYIYSLEDPKNPKLRYRAPGAISTWRDMKYYNNHIYVTHDQDTFGLTIIDVSKAPDTITHTYWNPIITVAGTTAKFVRAHNIYIDSLGFAYLAGHNLGARGVMILDLKPDPKKPTVMSAANRFYSHDAYVVDNKLYSSELSNGFAIYDVTNKSNPVELGRGRSTNNFTHNAWLSSDLKYLYTTDEKANCYVESYNVYDPKNIKFLDKIKTMPGTTRVIPHNTHTYGDYAVTSWYTDGIIIKDISDPKQMTIVGRYDTYTTDNNLPASGSLFFGCWGAYPYLPSGILLASDINTGLYVLKPTYQKKAKISGNAYLVIDKDTMNIDNLILTLAGTDREINLTSSSPSYDFGLSPNTLNTLYVSRFGRIIDSVKITPTPSQLITKNFYITLAKHTVKASTSANVSIPNVGVLIGNDATANPNFYIPAGKLDTNVLLTANSVLNGIAAAWGYIPTSKEIISSNASTSFTLNDGYQDDFVFNLGWTTDNQAPTGKWEFGIPIGTDNNGVPSNPNKDIPNDLLNGAFVTGNGGGAAGDDDIDAGINFLYSPYIKAKNMSKMEISNYLWFYNGGGTGVPNDTMKVLLKNNRGSEILLDKITNNTNDWTKKIYTVTNSMIAMTDSMQLVYSAGDYGVGHVVEAGLDGVKIELISIVSNVDIAIEPLTIAPNPVQEVVNINTATPIEGSYFIYDQAGRKVMDGILLSNGNEIRVSNLVSGTYFLTIIDKQNKLFQANFIKN